MTKLTQSESLFQQFCEQNLLAWERIPESELKTPDYHLRFGSTTVAVEIEQIESLKGFNPGGVSSRTVGSHIRQRISEAREQVQVAAQSGLPTILLIYNTIDMLFGTEQHDFIAAMYGELTVNLTNGKIGPPFQGRNARLRADINTSFSGVGHIWRQATGINVTVYENVYAAHPLPFTDLPSCIQVVRVEVQDAA